MPARARTEEEQAQGLDTGAIQRDFVRKVYGILAIQLVVTFGAQRSSPPASAPPALSVRSLGAMCSVG